VLWWLELVYAHTKVARAADWEDPNWSMLGMGGYGPGAYFLLRIAVNKNNLTLAEWLLARGASPNATASHPRFRPKRTLYQEAMGEGFTEIAELLVRHGAPPVIPAKTDLEQLIDACVWFDREEVRERLASHPEYLQSPEPIFGAARRDRADVVALLLDAGVPIEIQGDNGQRPLHAAAGNNALRVARLLIDRGAEIDPHDAAWNSPPIGWAAYGDHVEMLDLLSRYSRDVWRLAFRGYVDRLREVLEDEPELARQVDQEGITPLWWLPDDESKALEIVELLLAHEADPAARNKAGNTAADWALKRGMTSVARRLAVRSVHTEGSQ
jgi:uncharacterized protein